MYSVTKLILQLQIESLGYAVSARGEARLPLLTLIVASQKHGGEPGARRSVSKHLPEHDLPDLLVAMSEQIDPSPQALVELSAAIDRATEDLRQMQHAMAIPPITAPLSQQHRGRVGKTG